MREPLNKKELIKNGFETYITNNPNVISAQIIKYKYRDKILYQPWVCNKFNMLIGDKVGYWTIEVAKEAIDKYEC